MFCTKCGKSVDDDLKFCPDCGAEAPTSANATGKKTSVLNKDLTANLRGKSWYRKLSVVFWIIVAVAIAAVAYVRFQQADSINSRENLSVIADLVTKGILANDQLKLFAKVHKCTSVSLEMNAPMDSLEDGKVRKIYKGVAYVEMFPRKSSWESNDNIEYAQSAITVRYDIMVVDAGKLIELKSAEMRDSDMATLLPTGESDESDEDGDDEGDGDETSASINEPPLDGFMLADKNHEMTSMQWSRFVRENENREVVIRNGEVENVSGGDIIIGFNAAEVRVYVTSSFSVYAIVSDPDMVSLAAGLKPRTRIAELRGRIWSSYATSSGIAIKNACIILSESGKSREQSNARKGKGSQDSVSAVAKRLIELFETHRKMTKEAVGWAEDPISDEDRKAMPLKLAEMSEADRTALLERFEKGNERLKEFIGILKTYDDTRKRPGQKPSLNADAVTAFLRLDPDKQKELLEELKANSR